MDYHFFGDATFAKVNLASANYTVVCLPCGTHSGFLQEFPIFLDVRRRGWFALRSLENDRLNSKGTQVPGKIQP
jgi:hypothetical protein